eukprot:CAMPEP_0197428994 /NCGR_PEP_ID=MMETSP1170-20131217/42666_1 /TAXON_ID=54406 /ORGANISM="Sarcinochrysis sp, Strain CCMP770" /LENGTH=98 /DNA_ID=CAMNT_0042956797 /DNA_START=10 /DNA_END=303 /DNA_ORIENTATION=-
MKRSRGRGGLAPRDAPSKKTKKPGDAPALDWTVAPDAAIVELTEVLPRLRSLVVVGSNSVTRALERRSLRFAVIANGVAEGALGYLLDMASRCDVPIV